MLHDDRYAIGSSLKSMLDLLLRTRRGSGRSTRLVEDVQDGDRIVCLTKQEGHHYKTIAREQGKSVDIFICSANEPQRIFDRPPSKGRTIFSHCWVADYFVLGIEHSQKDLHRIQTESSGFGEAHRRTSREAAIIRDEFIFR